MRFSEVVHNIAGEWATTARPRFPQIAPLHAPLTYDGAASIFSPMNFDISHLLEQWDYQAGQVLVRRFKSKDGIDRIQLRVDLGLLQMNAEGRPDGKRPFGRESLLHHYQARLHRHRRQHADSDDGFTLQAEDCSKLQQEALQYHHRYICLFQLGDHGAVVRDTQRNADAFDFVEEYAESPEVAWSLQQFRPQLLMMQVRARATQALHDGKHDEAVELIRGGIEELRGFYQNHSRIDLLDQSGEILSLEAWLGDVQAKRPLTERQRLEIALDKAVKQEDYEKAARVRDALRNLGTSP